MDRTILHADLNNFYASVECLYDARLQGKPVAVCGDPAQRHGIVLAKSNQAKACGIRTGDPVWKAKQLCPELVVVAPHFQRYLRASRMVKALCGEYTDQVESFGLDECWLDVTASRRLFGDGKAIADALRSRIRSEIGITASVGVSFNKVFAKLGSDYQKPDATTLFTRENYRDKVWPLPVSDLLYVGPATARTLAQMGVDTIGQLARVDAARLERRFGKNGLALQNSALGLDTAPVAESHEKAVPKSISNSTTPPRDIAAEGDVKCVIYLLSDSVAARLREAGFRARRVALSVRTAALEWHSSQCALDFDTDLSSEIASAALNLFRQRFESLLPLRSLGVSCGQLSPASLPWQMDLFGVQAQRHRHECLERTLDNIHHRFGPDAIRRGVVMADPILAAEHPKDDPSLHTVAFYRG